MISFSTIESDVSGNIVIKEDAKTKLNSNTARVTNVPTLDGGAVVVHSGTSLADKAVTVIARITKEEEVLLWDLFYNNNYFLMAYQTSLFLISIKTMKTDQGKLEMSIIIVNKEN